ncbi:MAG: putative toxin-antitoxin system toxin component, PIN family [Chloroflexia bacterium]|jgi:putative PIN family toxin of toxin-antitoxin system|nr:putative toxin-antitoxin system toxin component, PIN family [Chloroflexia bacterium]
MRACVDTNVLISYLLAPGSIQPPSRIVGHAFDGMFTLVLVDTTLRELEAKVLGKLYLARRIPPGDLNAFIQSLHMIAELIPQPHRLPRVTRDPRDDYLVTPAVLNQVDFVVSGDKDLLVLQQIDTTRLVSPAEFIAILETDTGA